MMKCVERVKEHRAGNSASLPGIFCSFGVVFGDAGATHQSQHKRLLHHGNGTNRGDSSHGDVRLSMAQLVKPLAEKVF